MHKYNNSSRKSQNRSATIADRITILSKIVIRKYNLEVIYLTLNALSAGNLVISLHTAAKMKMEFSQGAVHALNVAQSITKRRIVSLREAG